MVAVSVGDEDVTIGAVHSYSSGLIQQGVAAVEAGAPAGATQSVAYSLVADLQKQLAPIVGPFLNDPAASVSHPQVVLLIEVAAVQDLREQTSIAPGADDIPLFVVLDHRRGKFHVKLHLNGQQRSSIECNYMVFRVDTSRADLLCDPALRCGLGPVRTHHKSRHAP